MKLLITGASGLLGTRLCQIALRKTQEVYSVYSQHKPLYGIPVELNILDLRAERQTLDKIKPEVVVHAAALTDLDRCELEKDLAWKTNVEATKNLARLCEEYGAFLVYVSTDYVFDGEKGIYKETDSPAPINYYGLTKLKGEEAVRAMDNCCIVRGSVIYGSIPATGKTNFALWLLDKLEKKEEVKIVTDQWNSPTLNTNLAEMILEIVEKRITGTFHLAGATRLSRNEFAKNIVKTFNLDPRLLKPVSSKDMSWIARRPRDSSLNIEKAKRILDNKPLRISEALFKLKMEMS